MYLILLMGLIGLSIIVERMIVIMLKNRVDSVSFINQIIDAIQSNKLDHAISLCGRSEAALPQIMQAGLEQADRGLPEVQNAIELKAMSAIPRLEKRVGYLSMIANVATRLGLLGTIWGLITSFEAVAYADAAQKATLLSSGIAQALNTTAFGLIVAIPCMLSFAFLHEKTNELIDDINENTARVFQFLARNAKSKKKNEPQEKSWEK
jgi:biopolymer transport protein ExbB